MSRPAIMLTLISHRDNYSNGWAHWRNYNTKPKWILARDFDVMQSKYLPDGAQALITLADQPNTQYAVEESIQEIANLLDARVNS